MRPDSLMTYLKAQPFRPFRMVLNSGKTYDVRHPEFLKVGRDSVVVFRATEPEAPYDSFDMVSLLLIEHVEHYGNPGYDLSR
jgi:hypothetical protein